MDPRWQPYLGPVEPDATPEACALLAAGWHAERQECWIAHEGSPARMVSPQTWRALRDRLGFVRPQVRLQRA